MTIDKGGGGRGGKGHDGYGVQCNWYGGYSLIRVRTPPNQSKCFVSIFGWVVVISVICCAAIDVILKVLRKRQPLCCSAFGSASAQARRPQRDQRMDTDEVGNKEKICSMLFGSVECARPPIVNTRLIHILWPRNPPWLDKMPNSSWFIKPIGAISHLDGMG